MAQMSSALVESVERSTLTELKDVSIDDMIDYVHKDLKKLPDYIDLYKRYFTHRWNAYDLDFSQDVIDWREKMTEVERKAFTEIAAAFHHAERQVEVELPIFMLTGSEEAKMYLCTQLEDEARHTLFFDRFYREVVGLSGDSVEELLTSSFPHVPETFVGAFGLLSYLAEDLRLDPESPAKRVRYATSYFLWIEGVLALTIMKLTLTYCRNKGYLPGYYTGFIASCRDEARHVQFGMRFLRDSVQQDPRLLHEIHETLRTELAMNGGASVPAPLEPLGFSEEEVVQFMIRQVNNKLSDVGISLPPEIQEMVNNIQPEIAGG
ncbi:ribonucleotide-diphosphate reductase subunit beta [Saccharopolyspora hirsuta]|uniref:Ribonucleotide reductase n=1 Tax=Saccharopolyspora hirsuta TaxID=1837 RepID=A0A5M7BYV0_SACHI|nr:ribonucleotide-diphosphate reductase subunit beta [Saccharopolyspora hirsuta]KAA5834959.1 ribonucleotide reductase [Saccharopolyspora hirsuta]